MDEQLSIFDAPRLKIDKPIRLIELFAGIGAQAKALENLGVPFEHYRICEIDTKAVKSYNAIHGTHFTPTDITTITAEDLAVTDTDKYFYILCYSFPCQDLSGAGTMRGMEEGSGTRSALLWEVKRLLSEMDELPQVLLMENVPNVLKAKGFDDWCMFLNRIGYENFPAVLNASGYGVAQNRKRAFMVSSRCGRYYFPKPIPLTKKLSDYLEQEVPDSYFISEEIVEQYRPLLEREREREVSRTVRCGGRASLDAKHILRLWEQLRMERSKP